MSEEWGELSPERIGRATASRISDVIARTKSGYSASRRNYAAELLFERRAHRQYPNYYENDAMRWGKEHESTARMAYELREGVIVERAGFVIHPTIPMAGASPDGLVNNDGLVEIKCGYAPGTHIEMLKSETIPDKYIVQMQWQMACTGRSWCDFVSFDPRLVPTELEQEDLSLFIQHVPRDNKHIHDLEDEVQTFLAEVEATVIYLRHKYQRDGA